MKNWKCWFRHNWVVHSSTGRSHKESCDIQEGFSMLLVLSAMLSFLVIPFGVEYLTISVVCFCLTLMAMTYVSVACESYDDASCLRCCKHKYDKTERLEWIAKQKQDRIEQQEKQRQSDVIRKQNTALLLEDHKMQKPK